MRSIITMPGHNGALELEHGTDPDGEDIWFDEDQARQILNLWSAMSDPEEQQPGEWQTVRTYKKVPAGFITGAWYANTGTVETSLWMQHESGAYWTSDELPFTLFVKQASVEHLVTFTISRHPLAGQHIITLAAHVLGQDVFVSKGTALSLLESWIMASGRGRRAAVVTRNPTMPIWVVEAGPRTDDNSAGTVQVSNPWWPEEPHGRFALDKAPFSCTVEIGEAMDS